MLTNRALSIALTAVAAVAFTLAGTSAANADAATTALPDSKPTWLPDATHLGDAASSAKVSATVYLTPQGGTSALEAAATAVSTPTSSQYGSYLSASQYLARFAPTDATVRRVESFLTSAGLSVVSVGTDNQSVTVSGDVAAAEKAFTAPIARYRHNGRSVQAPSASLQLPNSIAGLVTAVGGLDTSPHRAKPADATPVPPPAGYRTNTPGCSAYYGQNTMPTVPKFEGVRLPTTVCGYVGSQLRSAYLGGTRASGSGVTVAIIDAYAAPTIAADAAKYAARNGDAAWRSGQFSQNTLPASAYTDTGADDCDASSWFGEETLDVEAMHALAQGANVRFYAAASCNDQDLLDTFSRVLDENKASIVTNSYGEPELEQDPAIARANHIEFLRAALQGVSVLFSSGDDGDENASTGTTQADGSASDPFVTAVGGTSVAIGRGGAIRSQTGWGTDLYELADNGKSWVDSGFYYGAGGGYSALYAKPLYQLGSVAGRGRGVPDVAMLADPNTGFLTGETQTFTDGTYYDESRVGGTSLASPLFAAMAAIKSGVGGHRLGFLNPSIYLGRSGFADVAGPLVDPGNVRVNFVNSENANDGFDTSVRTFDDDSSLTVTRGWDDVTGVGSPTAAWLTSR